MTFRAKENSKSDCDCAAKERLTMISDHYHPGNNSELRTDFCRGFKSKSWSEAGPRDHAFIS